MSFSSPRSSVIFSRSTNLLSTSDNKSCASCRKSCRRSSIPAKSLISISLEPEALKQVIHLTLIDHNVGAPLGIDDWAIHQALDLIGLTLRRHHLQQYRHQA